MHSHLLTIGAALTAILLCLPTKAENTSTAIFNPTVQTLKIYNPEDFMGAPMIRLGSDDRLVVSFDMLEYDRQELRATLLHCNSDWQPSQLLESEYLEGFNYEDIEDTAFSSNTFQHFVNYRLELPSPNLRPTLAGNYLLRVAYRDDPEDVLFQVRFQATSSKVRPKIGITTRTDRGANTEWQQLSIDLDLDRLRVSNPYSDLKIKIVQNSDPRSEHWVMTPMRMDGNHLIYEHQPQLIFPALNEFRRFETVRATYPGMHTDSVRFDGERYHAYLQEDADRSEREYFYDRTQNGRFLVREYNSTDSDLGADYVTVHFTLDFPQLIGADIYVEGEFSQWQHTEAYRMTYDFDDHKYHLSIPLKQGSYNYRYTAVGSDGISHPETVEGNHYETRNEYNIEVWHCPPGRRADELIAFVKL